MMVAGEFIVMALILMGEKSKMLIPRPEFIEDVVSIDLIEKLMNQLIDYTRFRDLAELLNDMSIESSYSIPRQIKQDLSPSKRDDINSFFNDITFYDIAKVFRKFMGNKPFISQK